MKRVYANYCVLVSFEVEDNWSDEDIERAIEEEYNKRGFDMEKFDDGEWEVVK